jgi:hypothetical protein
MSDDNCQSLDAKLAYETNGGLAETRVTIAAPDPDFDEFEWK